MKTSAKRSQRLRQCIFTYDIYGRLVKGKSADIQIFACGSLPDFDQLFNPRLFFYTYKIHCVKGDNARLRVELETFKLDQTTRVRNVDDSMLGKKNIFD